MVNSMCVYAPQGGCIENEKETCWEHYMDQELSATQDGESVIVVVVLHFTLEISVR